jgi:transcriptional regulator with XRE-family HTH domain
VVTAALIREARKRAGLSQAELAARLGRPQSSVARWESGLRTPSLEVVRDVARACELELRFGFARIDDSYDWLIDRQLELKPVERVSRMLNGVAFEPLPILQALHEWGVSYVLIGEVAAVLHGCPLTLDRQLLAVTPRSADTERVAAALRSLGAVPQPRGDKFHGLHAVEPWTLPSGDAIEVVPTPAGTQGFNGLRRDSTLLELGPGLTAVPVASIADLVRIADASPRPVDQAWRSALRTLAERTGRPRRVSHSRSETPISGR